VQPLSVGSWPVCRDFLQGVGDLFLDGRYGVGQFGSLVPQHCRLTQDLLGTFTGIRTGHDTLLPRTSRTMHVPDRPAEEAFRLAACLDPGPRVTGPRVPGKVSLSFQPRGGLQPVTASECSSSWCSCSSAPAEGGLMANSRGRRRRFGAIRRLPSGRWQARYTGPDGVMRPADDTFETKAQAEEWLTLREAEILEDDWIDPDAGQIPVPDYTATWIEERPGLRPKTVINYRS
jgi:hypothetical protein